MTVLMLRVIDEGLRLSEFIEHIRLENARVELIEAMVHEVAVVLPLHPIRNSIGMMVLREVITAHMGRKEFEQFNLIVTQIIALVA